MTSGIDRSARRRVLASIALLGLPWAGSRRASGASRSEPGPAERGYPRNDAVRVQGVVGAAHGNFERVRELVDAQPALARATWDWGFGDWETALGAASHTGRREIAAYLIAHGARPTIFSAAMLGQVDVVRAFLTADPSLHRLPGPHGISLFRHARAGGAEAEDVAAYLLERFGPDEIPFGFPGDEAVASRYAGQYRFREEPAFVLRVGVRNGWLMVGAGAEPTSRVLEVAPDVFHPTSAPAVRLRFEVVEGRARGLTIEDGPVRMTGRRSGDLDS